jgi:hypothetical protein
LGKGARCAPRSPTTHHHKEEAITTKTHLSNAESIALCQKNQAGVLKYFSALPTILLAGESTDATKIQAVFAADITATTALEAADADIHQKRALQHAARAKANATRRDLKAYVVANYGPAAVQMLEDMGFDPPKPRGARTVASKAKAVAASKATRAAGGAKAVKAKAQTAGTPATATTGQPPAAAPQAPPAAPAAPTPGK